MKKAKLTFGLLLYMPSQAHKEGDFSEPPTSRRALQALFYAPVPLKVYP